MSTLSITLPDALLDRVRVLAAARRLDIETYVLGAVAVATSRQIRGWRGDWLIGVLREVLGSLDGAIHARHLLDAWSARYPGRTEELDSAILELVADGILLPDQQLGYSLSADGRRLLSTPP
jgi:hypothetical protein